VCTGSHRSDHRGYRVARTNPRSDVGGKRGTASRRVSPPPSLHHLYMPQRAERSPSANSHSSAEFSNVCRASEKRKQRNSQSQSIRMVRSDASDNSDREGSPSQRGRVEGTQEDEDMSDANLGSEQEVSDDASDDSEGTRLRKREARDSQSTRRTRKYYRKIQEQVDGELSDSLYLSTKTS
jgi:hypothetical protein